MKVSAIREMSTEEVRKELQHARESLFNLRFRLVTSQLRDHNTVESARRDIARLETVLRERELAGEG